MHVLTAVGLVAACGPESSQGNTEAPAGSAASSTSPEPGTPGAGLDATPPDAAPSSTNSDGTPSSPPDGSGQPPPSDSGMNPEPAAMPSTATPSTATPSTATPDTATPDAPHPSTDSTENPPEGSPPQPLPTTTTDGGAPSAADPEPGSTSPDVRALFDAYWDFANVVDDRVIPLVGDEPLQLFGASIATDDGGLQLTGPDSSAASLDPTIDTSGDATISAWVKLDALTEFNTFISVEGRQVSALYLQKRSDHRLAFTSFSSDATSADACVATAEIQPREGEWYHVVGTRRASGAQRIYVDGVLSGKVDCPGPAFEATGGVSVGRGMYDGVTTDWMRGAVDDVGIAARVLAPEEVFDLYRAGRPNARHYLFAYFVEVSQGRGDGLRLAHSHDGLHWGAIGAGKVFMPPSVGGGSFRDPHVLRGPDDRYHLVWTTTCVPWAEENCQQDRGLGYANSPDLVDWSEAVYVTVSLNVEHVWAPETFFDPETSQFMIFWSSPMDDSPSASDPHDIYYVLTSDFETFSEPELLYTRPGRNFIDATIRAMDDGYLMVIKDEADGQKNLRALRSPTLFGPDAWTRDPSAPITGAYAAEGPSFLERDGELFVYFDKYGEGAYGALRANAQASLDSPDAWQDISSSVFFPGVRHGTPIEVPWDVYRAVALAAASADDVASDESESSRRSSPSAMAPAAPRRSPCAPTR